MRCKIIPVILCGGTGTRLWPLSRESFPKQFIDLNNDSNKSLLQQTQERIRLLENSESPRARQAVSCPAGIEVVEAEQCS